MMVSLPDYKATKDWVDLTTIDAYSFLGETKAKMQAKGKGPIYVFMGGENPPTDPKSGCKLADLVSLTEEAERWWVRGSGSLTIWVED